TRRRWRAIRRSRRRRGRPCRSDSMGLAHPRTHGGRPRWFRASRLVSAAALFGRQSDRQHKPHHLATRPASELRPRPRAVLLGRPLADPHRRRDHGVGEAFGEVAHDERLLGGERLLGREPLDGLGDRAPPVWSGSSYAWTRYSSSATRASAASARTRSHWISSAQEGPHCSASAASWRRRSALSATIWSAGGVRGPILLQGLRRSSGSLSTARRWV